MTESSRKFGSEMGCHRVIAAEKELTTAVLRFIQNGLWDYTRTAKDVTLGAFEALIDKHYLTLYERFLTLTAGAESAVTGETAAALVYKSLLLEVKAFQHMEDASVPPLGILNRHKQQRMAKAVLGRDVLLIPDESKNPLQTAYDLAMWRVETNSQRVVLLSVLNSRFDIERKGKAYLPGAVEEFSACYRYLWNKRRNSIGTALALGTLLGGEAIKRNKKLIAKMYGPEQSLVHLLHHEGHHPGRYESRVEDDLRASINEALGR